ncbi:MAG TPA: hypothetical protein VFU50_13655 [Terriglobales bacterium]|nr:hypothetical protein [Terriglobales bacterium]
MIFMRFRFAWVLLLFVPLIGGCARAKGAARVNPTAPPELIDPEAREKVILSVRDAPYAQQRVLRDDLTNGIIVAINNGYRDYKNAIFVGRASFDTGFDFANLILSGLTAVTGGESTKAAFGAASAGITGARSSVNLNFFNNATRESLFNVMDSLRTKQLQMIRDKLAQNEVSGYSMSDALVDLEALYDDGNILTAEGVISAAAANSTANTQPQGGPPQEPQKPPVQQQSPQQQQNPSQPPPSQPNQAPSSLPQTSGPASAAATNATSHREVINALSDTISAHGTSKPPSSVPEKAEQRPNSTVPK